MSDTPVPGAVEAAVGPETMRRELGVAGMGPEVGTLLLSLALFGILASVGSGMAGIVSAVVAGLSVLWCVRRYSRRRDCVCEHERGIVIWKSGTPHVFSLEDELVVGMRDRPPMGIALLLMPLFLTIVLAPIVYSLISKTFRVRVLSVSGGACADFSDAYRDQDDINTLMSRFMKRAATRMLARVRLGETVIWTSRLGLDREGLLILKRGWRPGGEPQVQRRVPFTNMKKVQFKHGHLLIRTHKGRNVNVRPSWLGGEVGMDVWNQLLRA